jgi:AcrR family transcriptional regulator
MSSLTVPPPVSAPLADAAEASSAPTARHLRADAQRNRDKILAAAEVAFREQGSAVQMEDIAHRASVGVGTLYRHFPTKENLVAELFMHRFSGCIAQAESALESADPWSALECFVHNNAEAMAVDAGLRDALTAVRKDQNMCSAQRGELNARIAMLLERGQRQGSVRPDVEVQDMQALMCGLSAAIADGGQPRLLASVLLAGLRAQDAPRASA